MQQHDKARALDNTVGCTGPTPHCDGITSCLGATRKPPLRFSFLVTIIKGKRYKQKAGTPRGRVFKKKGDGLLLNVSKLFAQLKANVLRSVKNGNRLFSLRDGKCGCSF